MDTTSSISILKRISTIVLIAICVYFLLSFLEAALYLNELGKLNMLWGSIPLMFVRLPLHPLVPFTKRDGTTVNVPRFVNLNVAEISAACHEEGPKGVNRSVTRIYMRDGTNHLLNLFEDEVLYILTEICGVQFAHYDYLEHQERRDGFRQFLMPNRRPTTQRSAFTPSNVKVTDSIPSDLDRVGAPSFCTMCENPVEDGQVTMVFAGERICLSCAEKISAEVEAHEANPALVKAMEAVKKAQAKPASKATSASKRKPTASSKAKQATA